MKQNRNEILTYLCNSNEFKQYQKHIEQEQLEKLLNQCKTIQQ
jgi:hypothetical protein